MERFEKDSCNKPKDLCRCGQKYNYTYGKYDSIIRESTYVQMDETSPECITLFCRVLFPFEMTERLWIDFCI